VTHGARVAPGRATEDDAALARPRGVVAALLNALRAGDVEGIVAVLDPNVVVHAEGLDGRAAGIRAACAGDRGAGLKIC